MKLLLPALAALSLFLFTNDSTAQPPGKGEKNANGQRRQGQGRPGQGGFQMDLAQMATRAIQQFDKDGGSKLDARELTAFMTAMRDRRMGGGQGRPGMERGKSGKGQRLDGSKAAGGEKPKRPPVEE